MESRRITADVGSDGRVTIRVDDNWMRVSAADAIELSEQLWIQAAQLRAAMEVLGITRLEVTSLVDSDTEEVVHAEVSEW